MHSSFTSSFYLGTLSNCPNAC